MTEDLSGKRKVVGLKQTNKAIASGTAAKVVVAKDAEERVKKPIIEACSSKGIEVFYAESMAELGKACGIEVGCAVLALL